MKNLEFNTGLIDSYFKLLKNLSDSAKEHLIDLLTKSLKKGDKKPESTFELYGSWMSEESADQIIDGLKSDRYSDRQIEDM